MKPASRWFLAVCVLGSAITALTTTAALRGRAHGSEARYVREVDWSRPRIAHTYGLSYSELGLGAYRNEVETRTVGGRQCVAGGLIGFDVDDGYAFDVDEPVTLTLTYAPALTAPFTVVWDRNGGDGLGRAEVRPEAGEALQSVTLTLDRARLAGHGTRGIDIAVGSRDGLCVCDVEVTRSGATEAPTASGRVRLQITDASSGRPVPARIGLYDATGRMPLPSDDAILQQGRLPTDLWYGFLNLGYKLLPAAGSDFPYMDLPGVVRSYAKIDGPFSVDAWFDAFRAGRLFVTNGPLLEVTANGRPLGDELHVEPGATVEVMAEASLNPDLDGSASC